MKQNKYDYSVISRKYGYETYEKNDIEEVYKEWKRNLSLWECICLSVYRTSSNMINRFIRVGSSNYLKVISKIVTVFERGINSAITKGVIDRNIAVYRNLARNEGVFFESIEVGDVINRASGFGGYKGTHVDKTIDRQISNMFRPRAYAIFLIPKGTSCAYINYWGIFSYEHELLLNKDLAYVVKEKRKLYNRPLYVLEVKR